MWRALFLAIGIFLMIVGLESLTVDRVLLRIRYTPPPPISPFYNEPKLGANIQVVPPHWAPWTLLGTGAVTCLYSFTIPRRVNGN